MKIRMLFIICSMGLLMVLVTAGILEAIPKEQIDISLITNQYSYAGTFKVMILGEEFKWVDNVQIIDREIIITAKSLTDRTYEECVSFGKTLDEFGEYECLKYENITYPKNNPEIKNIPITKEDNVFITSESAIDDKISYKIPLDTHYIKIGENSIIVIEDIITNADLVNITVESDFTHLNISDNTPYDSLVLYMPFDSNRSTTTVYDYTENDNDGTIFDNVVYNSFGKYGGAVEFDGSGDYIAIADDDSLTFTGGFTWCMWMNPVNTDADGRSQKYDISSKDGYLLMQDDTDLGEWRFLVYQGGSSANSDSTGIPPTGNWQHICGVRNDTDDIILYVDTVSYYEGLSVSGTIDSSNTLKIGAYYALDINWFNGLIDEVMIFSVALTPSQITDLYNNQSARFKPTGTHGLTQNISSGFEGVQITGELQTNIGSSINLSVGYYDGGWTQTTEQVYDGDNTFTINSASTNISLNFTYFAGSNNGNFDFYSPIILGENGITLTLTYPCAYSGSGNWNNNQYCEYTDSNFNIDGNLTIFDGGVMNCTVGQCNLNFTSTEQYMIFENVADTENKLVGNWTINAPV